MSESEIISEEDVRFETFTTGGPGGQHANRTASGVKAIHIPTGITAIARDHRSQYRNRKLALERLRLKLKSRYRKTKPRLRTCVPASVREKRRKDKEHQSRVKGLRRRVEGEE